MRSFIKSRHRVVSMIILASMLVLSPFFQVVENAKEPVQYMKPSTLTVNKIQPLLLNYLLMKPDEQVEVIVSKSSNYNSSLAEIEKVGTITANWDFINAAVITTNTTKIFDLAKLDGINFIVLNQEAVTTNIDSRSAVNYSHLTNAYPFSVNAHKVWQHGIDGSGVSVAVIDSGISRMKEDFGQRVVTNVEFNSNTRNFYDEYGHGTHVAGIIGGDGKAGNGKYIGIAPGVRLLNVKFSSANGSASEADLIHALQWVYQNKNKYNIRVANISSSIGAIQSYSESAVAAAVEQLWFAGVVVVVSAGNDGNERCSTCHAPANDPFVITVGTIDDHGTRDKRDDTFKRWSSHGYTLDGHKKPEVMAPGVNIISYLPKGNLQNQAPERIVDHNYFKLSGSSMSAPVVSGVVALMLQKSPHLTPDQVKWIITHTTRPYKDQPTKSPGVINAYHAVFYQGSIGTANQHLAPSKFINRATNTISNSTMSWSNMSWSNMSWSNHLR
jgi:serine protease AprX